MRHKEVHVINAHPSVKFALDFGLSLISEKIKKRVKIYTNLDEAINCGEIEVDVLPKEYGGVTPMSEMIGKFIAKVRYVWINNEVHIFFLLKLLVTLKYHVISSSVEERIRSIS